MQTDIHPKPDLDWAAQKIKGFAELKEKIDQIKADELKYKNGDHSHRSNNV